MRESTLTPAWRGDVSALLRAAASLRLTLAIIVLFAAALIAVLVGDLDATLPVAVPLLAFAVNLAAAIATHPVFRREWPLLAFHLALLALVVLVAVGRLTGLRGEAEVTVGATFDGTLSAVQQGPLHRGIPARVRFVNEGYTIAYSPGMKRDDTRNVVSWHDGNEARRAVIGDHEALTLGGYRFYTSHNKGYAPLFRWRTADGATVRGSVHLPSYPLHSLSQAQEWRPPGAPSPVWIMLDVDAPLYDPDRAWSFRLPETHRLIVRVGERRHELQPGDRLALADGVLHYDGLALWMGYSVFRDPTLPWLLVAATLAVASLAWHFARKFRARPWDA